MEPYDIPRRDRLKVLTCTGLQQVVAQFGQATCYICGKSTTDALVWSTFKGAYAGGPREFSVLVCVSCVTKTRPSESELERVRAEARYLRDTRALKELWGQLETLSPAAKTHPVFHRLLTQHDERKKLPPTLVREAMSLANVFSADQELWQSYCWLQEHSELVEHDKCLKAALLTFAGVGGVWPSAGDRRYVASKKNVVKDSFL